MTSSSNLSPAHPKVILIHGMNNNQDCFFPLRDALQAVGFRVEMIVLPNHGSNREEVRDIDQALSLFDESLSSHLREPYHVIAFSQGAQYFQLWMQKFQRPLPQSYILLAPAVFIRYLGIINRIFEILPARFFILSQMPRIFRRYDRLYIWEYHLLMQGVKLFPQGEIPLRPDLVIIDPKDELVDSRAVIRHYRGLGSEVWELKRKKLKNTLGKHHIIFHPDYFQVEEWKELISRMKNSLITTSPTSSEV